MTAQEFNPTQFTRRQLLGAGSAAGLIALPTLMFGLGPDPKRSGTRPTTTTTNPTTTMWRLQSDWGFPLGPGGSSSCGCNACRSHSANKLFFERADAETTRAHPGCRCVAETVEVKASAAILQALSADGRSIDRRYNGHTSVDLRHLT